MSSRRTSQHSDDNYYYQKRQRTGSGSSNRSSTTVSGGDGGIAAINSGRYSNNNNNRKSPTTSTFKVNSKNIGNNHVNNSATASITTPNNNDNNNNVSCHFRYTGCYLLVIISDGCDMLRQEQLCHLLKVFSSSNGNVDADGNAASPPDLINSLDALDSEWNRKFVDHTIQQIAKGLLLLLIYYTFGYV